LPRRCKSPPATNVVAAGNQGGPFTPSSFQYQLSATVGSIDYTISGVPNWLTPSSTSGTASPSGTTVTFTVNANANSLAVGTYGPTTITFTNSDTGQGTQTRTATLIVNPLALQVVPTTNVVAAGNQGGPFSPSSFSYTLGATYGSVNYSISGVPSWLTPSSTKADAQPLQQGRRPLSLLRLPYLLWCASRDARCVLAGRRPPRRRQAQPGGKRGPERCRYWCLGRSRVLTGPNMCSRTP
jgi:hypothetical protein